MSLSNGLFKESIELKTKTFDIDSSELKEILESGRWDEGAETWVGVPKEVATDDKGIAERVIMDLYHKDEIHKPGFFKKWALAVRAYSLTATLMPALIVLCYGLQKSWNIDWLLFILATFGAIFSQIAVNIFNDVEDHLKLIDLPNNYGGSGVLQKGWFTARGFRKIGFAFLLLAILFGILPILSYPQFLIAMTGIGILGVIGYSNFPFGFKYKSLGDLAVFFCVGPVLALGIAVSAFGHYDKSVILLGSIMGFAAVLLLHVNNLQDIPIDEARQAKTFASSLGFRKARYLTPLLAAAIYAFVLLGFFFADFSYGVLMAALLSLPIAWRISQKSIEASSPFSAKLESIRFQAAQYHLVLGLLICLGFVAQMLFLL
jgi:1,4-dihydroxy-2-naphthoate octaprenyltransferase